MGDSNPLETFGYVAEALGQRKIAFLCTREHLGDDRITPELKKRFGGAMIANEGFTGESAQAELNAGHADAVAFGKDFIANPDLPQRLKTGAALNPWHGETFYGHALPDQTVGYTDYPVLN
jgi:2,4-dienoyl-CoA reductase-like NADH-dependent reductase (Old Yellow Enzyme family)